MTLSTRARAGGHLVSELDPLHSREQILVLSGQNLSPGHVMGKELVGATATPTAAAGNTGTGSIGTVTPGPAAQQGRYTLTIIEPAANAGNFEVEAPDGQVATGTVAVAFSALGLGFTLADATDFVAGDQIYIDVSAGTFKFKEYDPANTDGSQHPCAILWDYTDATLADTRGAAHTRGCVVNAAELVWFTGATDAQKAIAIQQLQDNHGIIVRTALNPA